MTQKMLVDEKPITLTRMIQTIEEELGKKAIIDQQPKQPGDVNKTVCEYSKAQRLLNYNPLTTFKQGIHKFVEWYLKK